MSLEQLLAERADLWRGYDRDSSAPEGVSTGFAALDQALPWRGWPPGSLIEILTTHQGAALALMLPMLVALSRRSRWLLLVDPPLVPFAPALAAHGLDLGRLVVAQAGDETAWAMEQALRSGACAAVLGWQGRLDGRRGWPAGALRRLQLAAAAGDALAILLREPDAAARPSPAVLRLRVESVAGDLVVTLLKQRGGRPGTQIRIDDGVPPC
jgi:protein ImuA